MVSINKKQPLVTIMVSYYNDNNFLKENIDAILNQTYENWELILLNHASTDNSREIARSYNDKRISHIDYPVNLGAMSGELYYQMFKRANGKYVKFFSADDKLKPNGLEILVNYMEEHPEKGFAFGNVEYIDARSQSLNDTWFDARPLFSLNYSKEEILDIYFNVKESIFPFAGHIIRKEILSKENFNSVFILYFDVYLWFSLMISKNEVGLINKIIAYYRIHDRQLTAVSKFDVTIIRLKYEMEYYRKLLFRIKDIDDIRLLCRDSKYIEQFSEEKEIPFILAEYLFNKFGSITAYNVLLDLLNDEGMMLYLREKFGFTIGTLRALYSRKEDEYSNESWHERTAKICFKLSIFQILYMILIKIKFFLFRRSIKELLGLRKRKYSL